MHTTILGIIALMASVAGFALRRPLAGAGLLLIALALGFSFLITVKSLPVDLIGPGLTIIFAAGCGLIVYELKR